METKTNQNVDKEVAGKAKFTPGPWEIGKPFKDSSSNRCVDILYNKPPCETCKQPLRDEYIVARTFGNALPKAQQAPNVRLLAAAPDLFAALTALVNEYQGLIDSDLIVECDDECTCAVHAARAALQLVQTGRE